MTSPEDRYCPRPTCKALLLCDDTIVEDGTDKISLIGIFQAFALSRIPGRTGPFQAFIQLTNAQGKYEIAMEVRSLTDDITIARAAGLSIEIEDRHEIVNIIVPAPRIPIAREGPHDFVVFANDDEIDRQKFMVGKRPQKEHDNDN